MMEISKIKDKAHIFDLDGTLINSMGLWEHFQRDFLAKRGIPFSKDVCDKFTEVVTPLTPQETAAYAIEFFGLTDTIDEFVQELNDMAVDAYTNTVPLKTGVLEFLKNLRASGVKMAIATSSPAVLCTAALNNHNITHMFDTICLTEEIGYGKSRPDVFLAAAKKLNTQPKDCIVYEDSIIAMKTAKSVGMTVYAVYDKTSEKNWKEIEQIADKIIYDFITI